MAAELVGRETWSMPEDLMRYDLLAQEALRGVVRAALRKVVTNGLAGRPSLLHRLRYPLSGRPAVGAPPRKDIRTR